MSSIIIYNDISKLRFSRVFDQKVYGRETRTSPPEAGKPEKLQVN